MKLIQVYECLCDETRLRILYLLSQTPLSVSQMQKVLHLTQVKISKHLAYLKERKMVEFRRDGNRMIYSLPAEIPQELDANLKCLHDCVIENSIFCQDLKELNSLEIKGGIR